MTIDPIDLSFQDTPGLIASWLLRSGDECALIEPGPGSCHTALVSGLAGHGLQPSDISKVFLTHIHLDHAGGAGWWAQQGAQVYVHAKGAPHVVDPAKLIESATRIYGGQMQTLWGDILPAPAERVTVMNDGDHVRVGDLEVEAWDTPGHARHHLAFVTQGVCFTGDVAGVRLSDCDYLSVAAAPPQFEPAPYIASVNRLLAANLDRLCLAHFGFVEEPGEHLRRYAERIADVYQRIATWKREGLSSEEIAQRYEETEHAVAASDGVGEDDWLRYERANATVMCAAGIELFVTKNPA
jgi:glyoxylase-like metal-dependent hydrolase (beta-lactamase superfamily II)